MTTGSRQRESVNDFVNCGVRPSNPDYVLRALELPGILNDPELDEQAELVGANPLADDFAFLEVEDVHHPFLDAPPSRWTPRVTPGIGAAERHPQDDHVVAHNELIDVKA